VDLLLDASSSRMHCQEAVAAQGYILAESLARCGVPVRVSGFCSLRGYTVLRVLKDFGDSSGQVFRYFAAGWNRDGLVLRAAGELLEVPPEQRRLFLLLTDASPNDSRRISPGGKYPFGRDYADAPAVEDAAREVRALRKQGIRVGAVFMGPSLNVPAAETIYGKSLAHIRSMDQLAAAAGALIQAEIRELE
jgi:nitric oxide reductase activation protein